MLNNHCIFFYRRTCISSRDPYCGWNNAKCVTKTTSGSRCSRFTWNLNRICWFASDSTIIFHVFFFVLIILILIIIIIIIIYIITYNYCYNYHIIACSRKVFRHLYSCSYYCFAVSGGRILKMAISRTSAPKVIHRSFSFSLEFLCTHLSLPSQI